MQKILVTDFFGTLVADDIERAEYNCGYGDLLDTVNRIWDICNDIEYSKKVLDQMLTLLDRSLKDFLDDGNIIKIVTSNAGHAEGIEWFLKEILHRFKSLEQYTEQIEIWFADISEDSDKYILNKLHLFEENGETYFIHDNIKFGVLNKKQDIFNVIQKQYDLTNVELYALGNEYRDLMMLSKCIELGGKSAIIKENLYTYEEYLKQTTSITIAKKADMDYYVMVEDLLVQECSDRSLLDDHSVRRKFIRDIWERIPYEEWVEKRTIELYELLRSSQLDIQRIFEEPIIYDIINRTFSSDGESNYRTFHENRYNELELYPSFRDFKTRVLSIKNL